MSESTDPVVSRAMICRAYQPDGGSSDVRVFARFTVAKLDKILDRMNVARNHHDKFDDELEDIRFRDEGFFWLFSYDKAVEEIENFFEEHDASLSDMFESTRFNIPNILFDDVEDCSPTMVVSSFSVYWTFYNDDGERFEAEGMSREQVETFRQELRHAAML